MALVLDNGPNHLIHISHTFECASILRQTYIQAQNYAIGKLYNTTNIENNYVWNFQSRKLSAPHDWLLCILGRIGWKNHFLI